MTWFERPDAVGRIAHELEFRHVSGSIIHANRDIRFFSGSDTPKIDDAFAEFKFCGERAASALDGERTHLWKLGTGDLQHAAEVDIRRAVRLKLDRQNSVLVRRNGETLRQTLEWTGNDVSIAFVRVEYRHAGHNIGRVVDLHFALDFIAEVYVAKIDL